LFIIVLTLDPFIRVTTTYLGITEPINIEPPTARDSKYNAELEKILRDFNLFESIEESRKREEVLGKLNVIVKEWARQVSIKEV
jgi:poly(A) polymerase